MVKHIDPTGAGSSRLKVASEFTTQSAGQLDHGGQFEIVLATEEPGDHARSHAEASGKRGFIDAKLLILRRECNSTVELIKSSLAQFLKYVEDVCVAKKRDPFAALMSIAQDQQGFFTTKQAIEAGYADNTHPYHVRAGNWERIWRGIYRLRHYPSPEDGDKVAWYLWSRGRDEKPVGVYSHETALSVFDLGDFNPADLHMIVPLTFRRNAPVPKGVVLHRGTVLAAECTRLRGFAVCRPLRAVIDLAKANPTAVEDLRRFVSDARRRGLVTERELAAKRKECETDSLLKAVLP